MTENIRRGLPYRISPERFKQLKKVWGGYVSFALWSERIDDTSIIENNLKTLNPSIILVALNPTRDTSKKPWAAFHVNYQGGKGPIMRKLFSKWPFKGAYMTDMFKKGVTKSQEELESRIENNPNLLLSAESDFENELKFLGVSDPAIFILGDKAWKYWEKIPSFSKYRAEPIYHYAAKMSYKKIRENHRNGAIKILGKENEKGKDFMEQIMNHGMDLNTWYAFWDELEDKLDLKTPKYSRSLISWIHRITTDKPFTQLVTSKLYNNERDGINDRLAIGIKPNPNTNVAFELFPMRKDKGQMKKGELLFMLYGVQAQSKEEGKSEVALVNWLERNNVPGNLAKFIFRVGKGIQSDGDLNQHGSRSRYAQCVIKGFGDGKIKLLSKETGCAEIVSLAGMESLLDTVIRHKMR